jgi:histidine ammonia-lyase
MIILDGSSLTIEQLLRIADEREPVALAPDARERVRASRAVVERRALSDEPAYGINTGFGFLRRCQDRAGRARRRCS